MKHEDFIEDIQKAEKELKTERDSIRTQEKVFGKVLIFLLALLLLASIIFWVVPGSSIKIDPPPKRIPTISEIIDSKINITHDTVNITSIKSYYLSIDPQDENIKRVANKVTSIACDGTPVCQAKAIYYFVRDNIGYVKDPSYGEYFELPLYTLITGAGDCDDHAILAANLYEAIGIKTRFVFVPSHVYIQIYLPDAPRTIKQVGDWINLDPTCKSCDFGEISYQYADAKKVYLDN